MILSKEKVAEMIPQADPFVMVGNLMKADETEIITDFTVEDSNILNEKGYFTYPGLIENIAQSCAAGFGFLAQQEGGEEPQGGFIGSINKLKTYKKPPVGESITTNVEVVTRFENVVLVKGANYHDGEKLLECEMKIVVVP